MRALSMGPFTILVLMVAAACDSSTEPATMTISVASAVNLSQGAQETLPITLTRGHFDKPVQLTVTGSGSGVTAAFVPASVPGNQTTANIVVSATDVAEPGTIQLTVHAAGEGVAEQTATIDVTVGVTGGYSLTTADASLRVARGGGAVTSILIERTGGYADSVAVGVTGAPAGMQVGLNTAGTLRNDVSLLIEANTTVPAGSYDLVLHGTADGLADETTTLTVRVIAAPATASLTMPFCPDGVPTWFGYRNDGYLWTRALPTGASVTFDATSKLAIAFVYAGTGFAETTVYYATRAELAATSDRDCSGPKTIYGSTQSYGTDQSAFIVMGASPAAANEQFPEFELDGVVARPLDLIATRAGATSLRFVPDAMIIRRGLSPASGDTLPVLDFDAAEAFVPDDVQLTVSGLTAFEQLGVENRLWSATSSYGLIFGDLDAGATTTLRTVPGAQLAAGDLHELALSAGPISGNSGHEVFTYFGATTDRSETLGPNLVTPEVTDLSSTSYVRLRGRLTAQPQYDTFARMAFIQFPNDEERLIVIGLSAAFLGSTPAIWDLVVPEFGSVAGFHPEWMLATDEETLTYADAFSGRVALLFGDVPQEGESVRDAYLFGATSTARAALAWSRFRRPLGRTSVVARLRPQYFRR